MECKVAFLSMLGPHSLALAAIWVGLFVSFFNEKLTDSGFKVLVGAAIISTWLLLKVYPHG